MSSETSARNLDPVRTHTAPEINARIDRQIEDRVAYFSTKSDNVVAERIAELDREWDFDRVLGINASVMALTGCALTAVVRKRWVALPITIAGILAQQALKHWSPPVSLFRQLGVRTRSEIEVEKFALKALRGDFDNFMGDSSVSDGVRKLVRAIENRNAVAAAGSNANGIKHSGTQP